MLKSTVENDAYFAFRKSQVELLKTERLGVIHVSDLIKPCMRNVIYGKIQPMPSMSTEDMKSFYIGQAVHSVSNISNCNMHEVFLAYDYVQDKALTREECLAIPDGDPRWMDIILGSIDDVRLVNGEYIICDKKTTGSIDYFDKKHTPNESHKLQINIYAVLLYKCYGITAKWGCNIYISNSISKEERDKIIPIGYKLDDYQIIYLLMKGQAELIKDSLTNGNLPERTKCFLCDGMCPQASTCFMDDRVKFK